MEVSLSIGNVNFVLTPSASSSSCASDPSSSAVALKLLQTHTNDTGPSPNDVIAELSYFTGTLRVSLLPLSHPTKNAESNPTPLSREREMMGLNEDLNQNGFEVAESGWVGDGTTTEAQPCSNRAPESMDDILDIASLEQHSDVRRSGSPPTLLELSKEEQRGVNEVAPSGPNTNNLACTNVSEGDGRECEMDKGSEGGEKGGNSLGAENIERYEGPAPSESVDGPREARASGEGSTPSPLQPTPLHIACERPDTTINQLRKILQLNPAAASTVNSAGEFPLHVIARNEAICISSQSGKNDSPVEAFLRLLINTHPAALLATDSDGRMPFTSVITEWVKEEHYDALAMNTGGSSLPRSRPYLSPTPYGVPESSNHDAGRTGLGGNSPSPSAEPTSIDVITMNRIFPAGVSLNPMVSWSLRFLSSVVDQNLPEGNTDKREAARMRQLSTRNAIAENIASIPQLVKTLLLVDDEDEREKLFSMRLIRRICLSSQSVDKWIVAMLKDRREHLTSRAVDYFALTSSITVGDYIGPDRRPRESEIEQFNKKRDLLFEAVGRYDQIIPSLVSLERSKIEQAATTQIVQRKLDEVISKPHVIGIILMDFALHVILMLAFRVSINQLEFVVSSDGSVRGRLPDESVSVLISALALHFSFRKGSAMISMLMISRSVFWTFIKNFWNVVDVLALVFIYGTVTWLMSVKDPSRLANLLAVTIGLLWLKFVGFLKAMNMELATFILAVVQILKDITWFCVILLIAILMFTDMIYIIAQFGRGNESCVEEESVNSNEKFGERTRGLDAAEDFCADDVKQGYLRSYAILIGDVSLDDFQETAFTAFLFVVFTFLGIIVLLNVLIAIISDSYEKSRLKSERLFGRARVELATEHISLQRLFFHSYVGGRNRGWRWCCRQMLRWLAILSIVATVMASDAYIVFVMATTNREEASEYIVPLFILSICTLVLNAAFVPFVGVFCQKWFRSDHVLGVFCNHCTMRFCRAIIFAPVRFVRQRLVVMTEKSTDRETDDEDSWWSGRLDYIERRTTQIVAESEKRLSTTVALAEDRIRADISR